MGDLYWPGDERAEEIFAQPAFLRAMVRVEQAWLSALVSAGVAPSGLDLTVHLEDEDVDVVGDGAEAGGNPLIPLLDLLRSRIDNPEVATWLHRGLTSQDVVDTALMLCAREAVERIHSEVDQQSTALAGLADAHRRSLMAGRTMTQHAVPITFGLKAAQWLAGVLDADDALEHLTTPAQFGGAAGTLAATVETARLVGATGPEKVADAIADEAAASLGLAEALPWHTTRSAVTRFGDACAMATDAWGRIANDVLVLNRPEIGELREATGGGSSTMPHKANPVLSVLVRRAALAAPGLAAQLHLASAESIDERSDGAWHLEWSTLATLARRTVIAASQTTELLAGLRVDSGRMAATAHAAFSDLLAEQRSLGGHAHDPGSYLGASDRLIDAILDRHRERR